MKKILFYCQNLLGMGHLVRTTEIIRNLVKDFQVCLIQGGQTVQGFEFPPEVEAIHLPAVQSVNSTLWEQNQIRVVDSSLSLEEVKEIRKNTLLKVFEEFQPDCLVTEGYPFSKISLSFELVPLLERARSQRHSTLVVCSLRDIIMVKEIPNRAQEEEKRCQFLNHYYDMLLIHSDPKIHRLKENFFRTQNITCPMHYTGYVVQSPTENKAQSAEDIACLNSKVPLILVSVGGGKLGHDLLECVVESAPIIEKALPHRIQVFTGPFIPDEKFVQLQNLAANKSIITIRRYTTNLLAYMEKASLSISLGGYNTTMNVLKTGVRSMIYPSQKDREQAIRAEKLEKLGILDVIRSHDLEPARLAQRVIDCLHKEPVGNTTEILELQGAEKTAELLKALIEVKASVTA
jgi:uncharacterized protein (TIGR00661 family)